MRTPRFSMLALTVSLLCAPAARGNSAVIDKVMSEQSDRIPRAAMIKAFEWYEKNADKVKNKAYVTIVNYNSPSTEKRMHIINMQTGQVEDVLCAHGKNSGNTYASRFSNKEGSLQSSVGIYLTAEQYVGKHGISLRLDGMEPTNSNVRKRDIVLHGAEYVSEETIKRTGRLGKSWGCLAVPQPDSERIVKQLKEGSVILVYRGTGPEAGKDAEGKIESNKEDE